MTKRETTTKNDIDESPYLFCCLDHLGLIFVSKPYNGDNFVTWKSSIETTLYAKGKGDFIDGSLPQPKNTLSNFQRWKRKKWCDGEGVA